MRSSLRLAGFYCGRRFLGTSLGRALGEGSSSEKSTPPAFDLEERLKPLLRFKHVTALEADVLAAHRTYLSVVIDDEHGLGATS